MFSATWRAGAQEAPQKPAPEPAAKSAEKTDKPEKSAHPAQIELLETKVRFEANGDSRKEVHALVKINSELGVRQFAQLNFDFNRSYESVEIPMVHITHASGGTADILPSAVTDRPNPAVVSFPAYQDVRVKSVRILGLQPGDTLEYRVLRTVTHHPLAPLFWLEHSFDRSSVVSKETFQVTLPASVLAAVPIVTVSSEDLRQQLQYRLYDSGGCGLCVQPDPNAKVDPSLVDSAHISRLAAQRKKRVSTPAKPADTRATAPPEAPLPPVEYGKVQLLIRQSAANPTLEHFGEGSDAQVSFTWHRTTSSGGSDKEKDLPALEDLADIEIGRISTWDSLSGQLHEAFSLPVQIPDEIIRQARQIIGGSDNPKDKAERIYDFVSQKIKTVDLPLGATGFRLRSVEEISSSAYGTPEDKFFLFEALAKVGDLEATAALVVSSKKIEALVVRPAAFSHLVVSVSGAWCDPSIEVAPFGLLPPSYRGSEALSLGPGDDAPSRDLPSTPMMFKIPEDLPFPSVQRVGVDATLNAEGKLTAKVHYLMRGDNELVLRVAFHHTPKEKWKEVAQLLSITDGFRGQVSSVNTSDPYATKEPFTVEYELDQPKFVDWSKKPVRIPALLPQLGLPDPPAKPTHGSATAPIDLGTPLEVETRMTLHLPPGTSASVPPGTSVERDYAAYSSQYSASGSMLTATRRIKFVLREVPAARAADYNAFLRAVQNDEAQDFTLESPVNVVPKTSEPKTSSAAPNAASPPKTVSPKP